MRDLGRNWSGVLRGRSPFWWRALMSEPKSLRENSWSSGGHGFSCVMLPKIQRGFSHRGPLSIVLTRILKLRPPKDNLRTPHATPACGAPAPHPPIDLDAPLYGQEPVAGVRFFAGLDVGQTRVKFLRQAVGRSRGNGQILVAIADARDGRDHRGGPNAERFLQCAGGMRGNHFVNGDGRALPHAPAFRATASARNRASRREESCRKAPA